MASERHALHAVASPIERVTVIGLGLIGGSLARALSEAGTQVVGWDAGADTRAAARAAGIIVADSLNASIVVEPDLIVLAVPLTAMADILEAITPVVTGKTLITDVGSIKSSVRNMMRTSGLAHRYVGSHPMAGTEKTGFPASSADLFHGAAWVVTLDSKIADVAELALSLRSAVRLIELVARTLNCRVFVMSDEEHDEAVALVSHLPHVFAAQLLNQANRSPIKDIALAVAAGSFRDGTRVAGTNPVRTEAMIAGNRERVAPLVEHAADQLRDLAERLRAGEDVLAFFEPAVTAPMGENGTSPEPGEASSVDYGTLDARDMRSKLIQASLQGLYIRGIDLATSTIDYRR